jgi:hypothetical protein
MEFESTCIIDEVAHTMEFEFTCIIDEVAHTMEFESTCIIDEVAHTMEFESTFNTMNKPARTEYETQLYANLYMSQNLLFLCA